MNQIPYNHYHYPFFLDLVGNSNERSFFCYCLRTFNFDEDFLDLGEELFAVKTETFVANDEFIIVSSFVDCALLDGGLLTFIGS